MPSIAEPVRLAVVGAGAVGSILACLFSRLPPSSISTYIFARGEQLAAIRQNGIRLQGWPSPEADEDGIIHSKNLTCVDSTSDASAALNLQFDYVIVTVKAHAFASTLGVLQPLLGDATTVVTVQNGIPWWYKHMSGLPDDAAASINLSCIDPEGIIWNTVGPERVLGAVSRIVVEVTAPGLVKTFAPWARFAIAELDGSQSPRLKAFCGLLEEAGGTALPTPSIQKAVWAKLMGNSFFNPVTALTLQTWSELAQSEHGGALSLGVMQEVFEVAKAAGVDMEGVHPETSLNGFRANISDFKSSMLQDLERGRKLEVDALLTAPITIAKALGVKTPLLETLRALVLMRQAATTAPPDTEALPAELRQ